MARLLKYEKKNTWVDDLTGVTKLVFFLLWSLVSMIIYDTRVLVVMLIMSLIIFKVSKITWKQVGTVFKFILFFLVMNLIVVFLFSPYQGTKIYGTKTVLFMLFGKIAVTKEQLFYEFNIMLKYFTVAPAVLMFICTTNPSEFAASLNRIGVPYNIGYSVAIALRYIPDVQGDFTRIQNAQAARGIEMSQKASLFARIKNTATIIFPLIFTGMDRIDTISNAMELRRFGKEKKRTWYSGRPMKTKDYAVMIFLVVFSIAAFVITFSNGSRFYNPFAVEVSAAEEADGIYFVDASLIGGSGRARIQSPVEVSIEDGKLLATIIFSSPYYDYMIVEGEKYEPVNTEGDSTFQIPVPALYGDVEVIADTIAMSEPHEIEYVISLGTAPEDHRGDAPAAEVSSDREIPELAGLTFDHSMELKYATEFAVDYYQDGYKLITIADKDMYLVVPEGKEVPQDLQADIKILQQPLDHVYLVASSAMDLICAIDGLDSIALSGLPKERWYIEKAITAMEEKKLSYAGKYSAPDYELILASGCDLAIESTMIYHSPDVQEKLETLGIPVLVEHSSYEGHPLGRTEWMKLYAAILNKEDAAEAYLKKQEEELTAILDGQQSGKTIAFFSINSNGSVTVRKSGDYVSKMIELAGGSYIFSDLGDENALSTMNMQMEEFYEKAHDCDILIYNSAIEQELSSIEELLGKSSLLSSFRAVEEGNVWCTGKSMFQETTGIADMILDIHKLCFDDTAQINELTYMKRLQ